MDFTTFILGGTDKHSYGGPHLAGVLDWDGAETYGEYQSTYLPPTKIRDISKIFCTNGLAIKAPRFVQCDSVENLYLGVALVSWLAFVFLKKMHMKG